MLRINKAPSQSVVALGLLGRRPPDGRVTALVSRPPVALATWLNEPVPVLGSKERVKEERRELFLQQGVAPEERRSPRQGST